MSTVPDVYGNKRMTAPRLTHKERRIIRLMIDEDPAFLRRLRNNPRTNRIATRLLRAYRAEMLRDLREHVGSGVSQAANDEREYRLRFAEKHQQEHAAPTARTRSATAALPFSIPATAAPEVSALSDSHSADLPRGGEPAARDRRSTPPYRAAWRRRLQHCTAMLAAVFSVPLRSALR